MTVWYYLARGSDSFPDTEVHNKIHDEQAQR